MNIDNMAAIVTGGASGLGAGTAERLAAQGAKVTIFDLNPELGEAKAKEIGGHFVAVNVVDEAAVAAAIEEAEGRHGKARILVNCAGIVPAGRVIGRSGAPIALNDFAKGVTVNLVGTFNVLSKFAARIHDADPIGEERGVIINTASIAAYEGQIGQLPYAAAKGGVVGMTLVAARDLSPLGIRVVTIAPGTFLTPAYGKAGDQLEAYWGPQVPFPKRMGRSSEYGAFVQSIVENDYLNGEVIRLDGALRFPPK